jgi:Flp pilus assembly protein CpaB
MTKTRLLVGLAIAVAIAATALMLYVRWDRKPTGDYFPSATVVVATEDIPNGARLDPLIEKGIFVEVQIPQDALIEDAVTDIRQLEGAITVAVIVKNEQISPYRLSNPNAGDISD